jgi:hypothetical protein
MMSCWILEIGGIPSKSVLTNDIIVVSKMLDFDFL